MTGAEVLALALALPEAHAAPHMERTAVRRGKGPIFATIGPAGDLNVKLTPDEQAHYAESAPSTVAALPKGWGAMGWTRVELAEADPSLVRSLLQAGWRNAVPKPRAPRKRG